MCPECALHRTAPAANPLIPAAADEAAAPLIIPFLNESAFIERSGERRRRRRRSRRSGEVGRGRGEQGRRSRRRVRMDKLNEPVVLE